MIIYIFSILAIVFAIICVEIKDLLKAILTFMTMNIFISIVFYLIGAPYVAVFQLSVYAGGITVLLLAFMYTARKEEVRKDWLEEILARTLLIVILLYILIFNPDVFKISLIGYSVKEKFEDKPYFLWVYRGMDVIIQAFMLFAAAISIAALFRSEKTERGEKSG